MSLRAVKEIYQTKSTIEGAGVKLQRAFGFGKTAEFDPFLLLDDFRNERPEDYIAGTWGPASADALLPPAPRCPSDCRSELLRTDARDRRRAHRRRGQTIPERSHQGPAHFVVRASVGAGAEQSHVCTRADGGRLSPGVSASSARWEV